MDLFVDYCLASGLHALRLSASADYSDYKELFPHLFVKHRTLKDRFLAVFRGGEGFRKVREAHRKRFHLS